MANTNIVELAQADLSELIGRLAPGDEVIITQDQQPVAKLISTRADKCAPRRPGTLQGTVLYMAPDFDAPLEEFKEYEQ